MNILKFAEVIEVQGSCETKINGDEEKQTFVYLTKNRLEVIPCL